MRYVNARDAEELVVGEVEPLITEQRAINVVNFDRMIVSRFGAFPQKYAIGWAAEDAFGMLIAVGLASMILFQLLVNVGMVIGIMPVTGIPLPFITYGGSSLISLLVGLGILQSVRMRSYKPTL